MKSSIDLMVFFPCYSLIFPVRYVSKYNLFFQDLENETTSSRVIRSISLNLSLGEVPLPSLKQFTID
jgi:hypothetical protein